VSFRSLVFNLEVTAKPFYTPFECSSSKVFYDSPKEFCKVLSEGGTWGDAWRRYFEVEAAEPDIKAVGGGIGRKRSYFWSLLGDWTLTLDPALR